TRLRAASRGLENVARAYCARASRANGIESHCFFTIALFPHKTLCGFLLRFVADRCFAPSFSHDRRRSPFGRRFSDIFLATTRRNLWSRFSHTQVSYIETGVRRPGATSSERRPRIMGRRSVTQVSIR